MFYSRFLWIREVGRERERDNISCGGHPMFVAERERGRERVRVNEASSAAAQHRSDFNWDSLLTNRCAGICVALCL